MQSVPMGNAFRLPTVQYDADLLRKRCAGARGQLLLPMKSQLRSAMLKRIPS
jgi:hypothetical protein